MRQTTLGLEMQVALYAIKGALTVGGAIRLLQLVIQRIKMRTGGMAPQVWTYPLPGSQDGGVGDTVVQPLVESFMATDSWPDHGGFYLIVASCRPFGVDSLARWLRKRGWDIISYGQTWATLQARRPSWLRRWLHGPG